MANDIAAIHVLKSKLQMTDDDYRALLKQLTGHTSSKDCTPAQRQQLRDHLQRLADRSGLAQPRRMPAGGFTAAYNGASPKERKVWAMWNALGRAGTVRNTSRQALDAFVFRQCGVASLRFCTGAQLDTLIESLKSWQSRGVEPR